ncbi:ABC transporter permease [Clostridiaceae bacterium HSG29]|nr:ABC transporter permease [Clostridiaceae bacterium HSG29]
MNEIINILLYDAPELVLQHLIIVTIALTSAIFLAVPLGVLLTREKLKPYSNKIIAILNTAQGVPSLAVIAIFLKFLGIGYFPSIVALCLYGLLPIAQNTIAGISNIDPDILESAKGIGLSKNKVLIDVELPLAFPVIIAGIQTSAVLIVGTAAIAQLIGAGGLGKLIFTGISQFRPELTIIGAILSALMAIVFDRGLGSINKRIEKKYK